MLICVDDNDDNDDAFGGSGRNYLKPIGHTAYIQKFLPSANNSSHLFCVYKEIRVG
jgi:hypothetical protein